MLVFRGEEDEHLEEQEGIFARMIPTRYRGSTTSPWVTVVQHQCLTITALSMCLLGVGRAAMSLFGTYVTHRYGLSISQVCLIGSASQTCVLTNVLR